jgi:hypothetical protein
MRVLFSSTRGAGHLQPLLPYARALVACGHEVAVAAPIDLSETLRDAGFLHFVFDRPGDDVLEPGRPEGLATGRAWRPGNVQAIHMYFSPVDLTLTCRSEIT